MGPDSDYRCGGKKGFKSCYVPAGISSNKLEGLAGELPVADVSGHAKPDSSKPFLKMEGYHMNVVPPLTRTCCT